MNEGLAVVGIHTPEFDAERRLANVKKAVAELGLGFPIALDNDYAAWNRYNNYAWPTMYLIDAEGRIVYMHVGEGDYARTEQRIQQLLAPLRPQPAEARR